MPTAADPIIRRMAEQAVLLGLNKDETIDEVKAMKAPKWSVTPQWVTFECGCRAERCLKLYGHSMFDPVIFEGQPEQGVYEGVCQFHTPAMNDRLRFGGYVDFVQWSKHRRRQIMGKTW
jgi:hypothetical protein